MRGEEYKRGTTSTSFVRVLCNCSCVSNRGSEAVYRLLLSLVIIPISNTIPIDRVISLNLLRRLSNCVVCVSMAPDWRREPSLSTTKAANWSGYVQTNLEFQLVK